MCNPFTLIRYAILNEAWRLIESGVLNARDIDSVMSDGLGMRWAFLGPLETAVQFLSNQIKLT